ncbi:ArdC-like ssDNA-binding domain-containing protein [Pirellulaceae bacterium SH449]
MDREEALRVSDDALQSLAEALRQGKSEQLTKYLDTMVRFHQYSFCNCMLIYSQKPDATHVAGFGKWKELNRFVRKGEKGIAILAPLVRKKKDELGERTPESSGAASDEKVLFGFRVVYVFDVSQTEGEEIPSFASLGGDPGDHVDTLLGIYQEKGIRLEFAEQLPRDANGMSQGGAVTIKQSLPPPQKFSTMVHELAHELLHWNDERDNVTKSVRETEAEAVAYVVCRGIGLECSTRASDYIQLWSGDEKLLLQSLDRIRLIASGILQQLSNNNRVAPEVSQVA